MATTIAPPPRASIPLKDGGEDGRPLPAGTRRIGMWLGLAAISMMFIGLTSAYVASRGLGPAWEQVHLRPLIWIDTAVLLLSSYTIEQARRRRSARWLSVTWLLGLAFLAGQLTVFGQLADEGLYLNTGRQSSFYYVLTGLHGLHVLGGILALAWTTVRMRAATLEVTSTYWHFMGVLWLYLLVVIFV
jgi:cytochrome c oxidase subunit III